MLPIFLSTPSARRATHHPRLRSGGQKISIHALREEGDQNSIALIESGKRFLSTPSARRATLTLYHADVLRLISIHALREEGDAVSCSLVLMPCYFYPRPPRGGRQRVHPNGSRAAHFYPRPPRGGRPSTTSILWSLSNFYPRPPRGGRQPFRGFPQVCNEISIHALREEGDPRLLLRRVTSSYFYPRPPRGGRRCLWPPAHGADCISIHALREEGDGAARAAPLFI